MSSNSEIINKVAQSGLTNFDISTLLPKGERVGIDIKDFLHEGLILREKEFREKIGALDLEPFKDTYVFIYNSSVVIIPLWSYFLLSAKLGGIAKKVIYGDRDDLELLLMHQAMQTYDFSYLENQRVLVKGCTDVNIPVNAYVELVEQLKPLVKSLMFGEACSNVPVFKRS